MRAERSDRRQDLAAFLRNRRERIAPAEVGLPGGARRRTPGLRREEVAQIAGVGLAWYTWLEQGRDINVSTAFLDALARALRLDRAERSHLFDLAHGRAPPAKQESLPVISAKLRRMIDSLPGPAYIATERWDVLSWNLPFEAVFGSLTDIPDEERNMLWLVFASDRHRTLLPDWETDVRDMLARFRLDFGRHKDEESFRALVRDLQKVSPQFRAWWTRQDVTAAGEGTKRFRLPEHGDIHFEHTAFGVDGNAALRLVVYTPLPGRSRDGVDRLTRRLREAQSPPISS
jgi:transcriptional regulator with XRE-family HTH domain